LLRAEVDTSAGALELRAELEVEPGRCLALLGPSGAGKTTLLRVITGLHRPREGRVTCGEEVWLDTAAGREVPAERRRCGLVFQDYALFGHLTARANVEYGLRGRDRRRRAHEWLERLGVGHAAQHRPRELSGGERQRVALARALAPAPQALLLDEPLAALDPHTRGEAGGVLREAMAASPVPAVLVTHDFAEAAMHGDEMAVLEAGRIVQRGSPSEVSAAPASAAVAALTGAVVLLGSASSGDDGLTEVLLEGGGTIRSVDPARGPVAATVFPWEVALETPAPAGPESARNRLECRVVALTPMGNRVRVGLRAGQALTAEVTAPAARELELEAGSRVVASWKATATRLVAR
jgi:molybdate transport system ATP-binding protein